MPLLDHLHPPPWPTCRWEAFHGQGASAIATSLNGKGLPKDYYAETEVHVGSRVEFDVTTISTWKRPTWRPVETAGSR